ncbi:MAG: hypothetical protein ACRC8S_05355 [Fimbriiglobus sp.]
MNKLVVKVGGSLFESPNLRPALKRLLRALPHDKILLVAGGGDFADAVRKLDRIHGLGENFSHRLAIESLWLSARFLWQRLDEDAGFALDSTWTEDRVSILVVDRWLPGYEAQHAPLPSRWDVTTDTLAAAAAHEAQCGLLLLKSVDAPSQDWPALAEQGILDDYFPTFVAKHQVPVEVRNFRRDCDSCG